jgi:Domain of unknown function DUF29
VRSSRNIAHVPEPLYETDYYAWIQEQVRALRDGRPEHLDSENVAEELEDLGKNLRRELQSRIEVILAHMLKLVYQPEKRTPSWGNTIHEQRMRLEDLLAKNTSLRSHLDETMFDAFRYARVAAGTEMGLTIRESRRLFPVDCPWTRAEILNASFLPKNPARRSIRA